MNLKSVGVILMFFSTLSLFSQETGLYSHGAGYYEPKHSGWMSVDPGDWELVNPMGSGGKPKSSYSFIEAVSWYSYVSNNPVRYVDPTGEVTWGVNSAGEYVDKRGYKGTHQTSSSYSLRGNVDALGDSFRGGFIGGWAEISGDYPDLVFTDNTTGFDALLFSNGEEYVLVFLEINPFSGKAWKAARRQTLVEGITEGQLNQATKLASGLLHAGISKSNLIITNLPLSR